VSRRRWLKLAAVTGGLVVVVVGVGAWRLLRVDDVPEALPEMERSPDELTLGSLTGAPDLKIAEQRGTTIFLVVIGPRSGESREGQALNRALNRWQFPDTTKGYIVADAEGAGLFSGKIEDFVRWFEKESRFPIYVDFEGATMETFKLTKGHHGFVAIGPDGQVLTRASGGVEGDALDEVRQILGATEPPDPDPAPEFTIGEWTLDRCRPRACGFIFLGDTVARTEIPGVEDGFDGDREEAFAKLDQPHIRLAGTAMKMDLQGAPGAVIGTTTGLRELSEMGWSEVAAAPEARAAFGLEPSDTAFVIVDAQGRLAFREVGVVPMFKWGAAADLLGAEVMPEEDD
jgi:hypothetical protein